MKEVQYHVFWNNNDEWFDNIHEAHKCYKDLGDVNKRLYEETYIDEELDTEDCIESNGGYPW